jgi:hypothetical protein
MRRQQRRSQGHGGGGFGGAWAGSESDTGDKWGRRSQGTGTTARDFARKQFQQSFQQSFDFSFQFPSFGDFFNNGFADAPVADTSDRSSEPSYFHKWFPQVMCKRSARSRVSVHRKRLPAAAACCDVLFIYSHSSAGPCSETRFPGGCVQSCCNPGLCSSSRRLACVVRAVHPHLRPVSYLTLVRRYIHPSYARGKCPSCQLFGQRYSDAARQHKVIQPLHPPPQLHHQLRHTACRTLSPLPWSIAANRTPANAITRAT